MKKISQDVLKVLDAATVDGALLTITMELDRKLYTETNKVLEAAGGKWNRSKKAHVFEGNAADAIEPLLLTGEYALTKQDFGQFDTPPELAAKIISRADICDGMAVLEPSVGIGNLARGAERCGGKVTGYDIDDKRLEVARKALDRTTLSKCDFLLETPAAVFDRVVMNPPFSNQADIKHVMHAFKFLRPGGILVAIMSNAINFRTNRVAVEFREFVAAHGGTIEPLPQGSFKESGTNVETCMVTLEN